jgi:prefoldin subunit 2
MRQDYADIFRVYLDIEDERKEHILVIDAIKNVDPTRRFINIYT